MKKYGVTIIGIILLCAVIFCGRYYFTHNKSYKNEAVEKGDYIYINGVRYIGTSELEKYNNTEDIPCLCRRRVLSFRSVGVQSPNEWKRFYESPLLVKSRALKISNVVICTSDRGMKLYEIEEYPDYEYIAGYHAWDGRILKRDDSEK